MTYQQRPLWTNTWVFFFSYFFFHLRSTTHSLRLYTTPATILKCKYFFMSHIKCHNVMFDAANVLTIKSQLLVNSVLNNLIMYRQAPNLNNIIMIFLYLYLYKIKYHNIIERLIRKRIIFLNTQFSENLKKRFTSFIFI